MIFEMTRVATQTGADALVVVGVITGLVVTAIISPLLK